MAMEMKSHTVGVLGMMIILLVSFVFMTVISLPLTPSFEGVDHQRYSHPKEDDGYHEEGEINEETGGSSLPDCSHACEACNPCKRVIVVGFKCSLAESCPIVYRCMCNGKYKYYHVPSN